MPLHGDAIVEILESARHTIIVENNYSGQFARYLRSETSFVADGHIRKYDGEPFMPHHIVEAVKEQLAGTDHAVGPDARNHGLRRSRHGDNRTRLFKQLTLADLKGKVDPDWCPGCGDFGVLAALQKALVELQIQPHNVVTISGIGCSSNLPGYINTYGMHTLHGRSLAVATGVKLANHELTVIVTGGDGDGFGIGGNHFIHTMRRNVDLIYIVDGQPDLRADHRPDLAHQPHGHEDQEHAVRQRRAADQSRFRWPSRPAPPSSRAASAASKAT